MTLLKVNPNGFLVILVSHVIEKRPYHVTQTQNEKNMWQKHDTLDSLQQCRALKRSTSLAKVK
jgi:hypothetical protein